jgi:hypothetical protein
MIGKELLKMFENGKKITIRFTKGIEQAEGMFQENMMAEILSIYKDDDYLVLKVDQTKYYESNKQFDVPSWLNKDTGAYDLSYSEYRKQYGQDVHMTEEIYDNYKDELYNIIVVEDNTKELYERYLKESEGKTYIEWLENIVLSQSINKL